MRSEKRYPAVTFNGFSRAIHAKHLPVRIIWAVICIVLLASFSFQLYQLIDRYLSVPISTRSDIGSIRFKFPNLFLCNPFPLSFSKLKQSLSTDLQQREAELNMMRNIEMALLRVNRSLSSEASLSKSLIERIGVEALMSTSNVIRHTHTKEQTIIKATINGDELDLGAFQVISSDEYLSCFQFKLPNLLKFPSDILSLYLYSESSSLSFLDDTTQHLSSLSYTGRKSKVRSSGLWLFATEEGVYPGPGTVRTSVPCGMHTVIDVVMIYRQDVSTPKRECRENIDVVHIVNRLANNSTMTFKMTSQFCRSYQWALAFAKHCGCIPLQFPIPASIRNTQRCVSLQYFSLSQSISNVLCTRDLQRNTTIERHIETSCQDRNSCHQKFYDLETSFFPWPHRSFLKSFVSSVLAPSYEDRLKQNLSVSAWQNVLNASDSQLSTMIKENVMKLDISPKKAYSDHVKEYYAYPAISLFSDFGGILGLYLGMSLISFCELGEWIVLFFSVLCASNKYRT